MSHLAVLLVLLLTTACGAAPRNVIGTPAELCTSAAPTMDLAEGFADPPAEARPRVYWWWLNGQVTRPAITHHLEELKAKGFGGVLLFDAGGGEGVPPGPGFMSRRRRELFRHAVREAGRLGLEVSVNLCSGWDCGGPWVTPELGCRRLASSQLVFEGPADLLTELPLPQGADPQDVAVLALPVPPGDLGIRDPDVSASSAQAQYPASLATDGDVGSFWVSDGWKPGDGPTEARPDWIRLAFAEPVRVSLVHVIPRPPNGPRAVEIQVSPDGERYETVARHVFDDPHDPRAAVIRFPEVSARALRLLITSSCTNASASDPWNVQVCEFGLGEPSGVLDWAVKAARQPARYERWTGPGRDQFFVSPMEPALDGEAGDGIATSAVVDLSDRLDSDGRLRWDVPAGRWRVLRFSHVSAGYATKCASPGQGGLEVDWLSPKAMRAHFAATAERLLRDAGDLAGTTLRYFHDDSWEVGVPNWTPKLVERFRELRGYDPLPYLPALSGYVVGSRETSERFLYDYRRTLADCLATDHYAAFRDLCHRRGVLLHSESGGPCTEVAPMDALLNLGMNDVPMGEFWQSESWVDTDRQNHVGKQTASAAHIYGKRFAAAEAFTAWTHWQESPADLKPTADIAFCEGINRCFLHTSTCSPAHFGLPGIEYFAGTHFNPNVTWWDLAGPFVAYLSRCQFLLSQGLPVADVCYYYGDQVPSFVTPKHTDPSLGPGRDYDVCNADVLLHRMEVRDGRIVLPDGVSYRLLLLPDRETMPLEVIRKLAELVEDGGTIVGPKPRGAPGLTGYPRADERIRRVADRLWGPCDGGSVTMHRYGRGRVFWGQSPGAILQADGLCPDFASEGAPAGASVDYIHRSADGAEVYFVANRVGQDVSAECALRITGRRPELWDPVSGSMRSASGYRQEHDRTTLPFRLAPYQSVFVVFRELTGTKAPPVDAEAVQVPARPVELTGPWEVRFDPAWGGPESVVFEQLADWTSRPEEGIRYYSGRATYRKTFDLPDEPGRASQVILDLGRVRHVAQVNLNGVDLGILWTAPWQVGVSGVVRPRDNELEVAVTNVWANRLIGDARLPAHLRTTWTNVSYAPDAPLVSSGLLGPAVLSVRP